ncbi:MAG: hypothetical protein H8E16_02700 [Flavobacteriales bacterium]|nr:hypothetical protein [Flavobacteriales bacterium]
MATDSTRATLKAHFNTGDQPTEANFTDLVDSTVNITDDSVINGSVSFAGGVAGITGVVAPTITSKTQMANGFAAELVKNTHYLTPIDGAAFTATLPAQGSSTVGDTIILEWHTVINTTAVQKVGTSGEYFMVGSTIYRTTGATGAATGLIKSVDVADGVADDFVNFTGLTNSGPGIGSMAIITFNGATWRMEANLTSSGTGIAANLSEFATA